MICEKIALGNSLRVALDKVGPLAPSMPTFWRWLDEYPEFNTRYYRARQMQADIHADVMLDLAADAIENPSKAAAIRVAADILKWQAETRDPKRYGSKAVHEEKAAPMSPAKLREEIKLLETELGVKATPGMDTAPAFKRKPEPAQPKPSPVEEERATAQDEASVSQRTEDTNSAPEDEDQDSPSCQPAPAQIIEGAAS